MDAGPPGSPSLCPGSEALERCGTVSPSVEAVLLPSREMPHMCVTPCDSAVSVNLGGPARRH
jgi:hypothetical protein